MKYAREQWDRVTAIALVLIGGLLLLLGWLGVRDTAYPAEQVPYVVSGGLAGIVLVGIGAALWISADLRDEWRKIDRLEDAVRQLLVQESGAPSARKQANGAAAPEVAPAPAARSRRQLSARQRAAR